jgi:hypothetical protein
VGVGLVMSPTNTDAMSSAPIAWRGQASGTIQTVRQVGGTVGIAVLGTLVANVQNDRLSDLLSGLGETQTKIEQTERILAENPAAQRQLVEGLPPGSADAVLGVSRDAMVDGVGAAYWASGGVMLVASLVAFLILRRTRYADEPTEAAPVAA